MMSQTGNRRGVTLVEVLLAVVVLSVGIVGVLRAYIISLGALEAAQGTIDSVHLARQKMADVEQTVLEQGGVSPGLVSGNFEGVYQDYVWQWETAAASTEALCRSGVTVSREGLPRQLTLVTYVWNKNYKKD
ncbi:MAG: prepilin-type N-terminal cleavage/methylation domain-containing protein [Candidatus Omnitrophica bacterium]|nr:prepilin-type N-terminal cleavage/methylation domain-containing protein [Candidatus Omnitrophota bacterium]